jgi:hypothetical protein
MVYMISLLFFFVALTTGYYPKVRKKAKKRGPKVYASPPRKRKKRKIAPVKRRKKQPLSPIPEEVDMEPTLTDDEVVMDGADLKPTDQKLSRIFKSVKRKRDEPDYYIPNKRR